MALQGNKGQGLLRNAAAVRCTSVPILRGTLRPITPPPPPYSAAEPPKQIGVKDALKSDLFHVYYSCAPAASKHQHVVCDGGRNSTTPVLSRFL